MNSLRPFPTHQPSEPRFKLNFNVSRSPSGLDFSFGLVAQTPADLDAIVIPERASSPDRKDELWKSTCLEIFFGPEGGREYLEMNLCPSGNWNLYSFRSYREGMKLAEDGHAPLVTIEKSPRGDEKTWVGRLRLHPDLAPAELAATLASRSLVMGATAVIEYKNGHREYWAIAHAGEKPDFHLRESFRLIL